MNDTAAAFDALWAACTANTRLVPMPPQWNQLYGLLRNTRQKASGGWESPREYVDRESHYVWGRRVLLKLVEADRPASVLLHHSKLLVNVRTGADEVAREAIVAGWYRQLLKTEVPPLIAAWEPRLGVAVSGFYVQQMKTKWGGCNPTAHTLRLNTELAKKPKECLEYIVVHEMSHLLEPTHGPRFLALLDRFMPAWRETRALLNALPARHERWNY